MTTKQHRCIQSGRVHALEARWLPDAEEYRTEHDCSEQCVEYHE
jgi:hypothetical protein